MVREDRKGVREGGRVDKGWRGKKGDEGASLKEWVLRKRRKGSEGSKGGREGRVSRVGKEGKKGGREGSHSHPSLS